MVDFGLASPCDVEEYIFRRCGTPGFVAPEVINSNKEDKTKFTTKCDIFSTGVIFFFMLTGKIPYEGQRFEEVIESNKRAVINFEIKELSSVPEHAMSLLRNMLEVDPEKRLSAEDCLKHKFFGPELSSASELDSTDEGPLHSLSEGMREIKNKINNKFLDDNQDSIHFKLNPTIQGNTDTYGSANKRSPNTIQNQKIFSINSPGPQQQQKQLQIPRVVNAHSDIYKYALTNGTKGVEFKRNPVLQYSSSESEDRLPKLASPHLKSKFANH